jgi:hypothetical protein
MHKPSHGSVPLAERDEPAAWDCTSARAPLPALRTPRFVTQVYRDSTEISETWIRSQGRIGDPTDFLRTKQGIHI